MPLKGIEVQGAKALRSQLRAAGVDLADLRRAHRSVADLVTTASRPTAPVASGVLAASVRAAGQAGAALVRAGSAGIPYANPIHWGWPTRHIPARPWLWDTVEQQSDRIVDTYQAAVQLLLDAIDTRGQP
jgi:hypothetical protein